MTSTGSTEIHALPATDPPRDSNPWVAMTAIALGVLIVSLDGTITAVANPVLVVDLGASLSGLQWITNIYLLAMAATLVLAGRLGDRFGRRSVFLSGIVGFGLASAGIALAHSVEMVIFSRLGQGIFGALIVTNALALLRSVFSEAALPKALAVFASLIGASSAAGPLIGGLLIEHTSWRWAFLINVPVAAISLATGLFLLPKGRVVRTVKFDVLGSILLTSSLLAITYGLIKAPESGWTNWHVIGWLVGGTVTGLAFVEAERRASDPLVPLRLFADRSITLGVILTIISFFALVGSLFFILLFLQQINGDSPMAAGLHILPMSIANVIASSSCGWIIKRYGARPPLFMGMLLSAVGFLLFTTIEPHGSYLSLAIPFVVLGLGIGFVMTASVQAILGNANVADAGPAAGVHQTSLQVGGILGTSVLGAVMAAASAAKFHETLLGNVIPDFIVDRVSEDAVRAVAQGTTPVVTEIDPALSLTLRSATETAFMYGLQTTMWVGAIVSLIGAFVSIGIRRGRVTKTATHIH